MDDLGPRVFFYNILGSLLYIVIEWDSLVPEFPEYEAETVGVHLHSFRLYLLACFKGLRCRPDARDPVIEEHVAINHKVIVLKVGNPHLYLESFQTNLLNINKDIM